MPKEWYLLGGDGQFADSGLEDGEFAGFAREYFAEALDGTFLGEEVAIYRSGPGAAPPLVTRANVWGNTPARESDSANAFNLRHLITRLGQASIGDYVLYKGDVYMVSERPGDNQVYQHSLMTFCNHELRWLGGGGEIVERKCVFRDATKYSFGQKTGEAVTIGDTRIELLLPRDPETVGIGRGRRFIIDDFDAAQIRDPMVYQVTKPNLAQRSGDGGGVLVFVLVEHSFNPATDSRAEMVADFARY